MAPYDYDKELENIMTMVDEIEFGDNNDDEDDETMSDEDQMLRYSALAMAIEAKCGQDWDTHGHMIFSDDKFVTAAAKFYMFLKEVSKEVTK
jgi:hypothetical protein